MVLHHNQGWYIKYQLLLSIAGLFLVVLLTTFPPKITGDFSFRKTLIGLLFSVICSLGILAVFSPGKCGKLLRKKKNSIHQISEQLPFQKTSNSIQGHHPDCGKYFTHILLIRDRIYCAACLGLLMGGFIAIPIGAIYFFSDLFLNELASLMILVGIVSVIVGLFQFKFNSILRLLINGTFVIGSMLILIGIDDLIKSLFVDLFVVCLIIFWLFTRISFSNLDHENICSNCGIENCGVRQKKKI